MFSNVFQGPITVMGSMQLILSVIFTYCLYSVFYNLFLHPLSGFPGPKIAAITRLYHVKYLLAGRLPFKTLDLHNQYGSVFRIAPDELSLNTAEAWRDIYGNRTGKPEMAKNALFVSTTSSGSLGLLGASSARHGPLRRLVSNGFSEKALRLQEQVIQQYCDLLMERLRENSKHGTQMVDMVKWYNFFTFDIIGDLTFGESFGCLEGSDYHPWVAAIYKNVKVACYMQAVAHYPFLRKFLQRLIPKSLAEQRKHHYEMTLAKVRLRQQQKTDRTDFLSGFLVEGADCSDGEIIATSRLLIIAGSDTTATLLAGITYLLMKDRRVYDKLVKEVRSSFNSELDIDFVQANKLRYMLACLDEALRMYPPVPGSNPRDVPSGGDKIGDKHVPQDTVVSVTQFAMYHSPENFHLPDEFIPERWLDDERFKNDNKAVFQPFSMGPRNCVGRNLAYFEMRIVLARLLFNFDLVKLDAACNDWANQNVYLLWEKPALMVLLKERAPGTKD